MSGEFKKLGVIGHPIAHSKSPLIHNYWINRYGLSGSYEALDIAPENLEKELRGYIAQGYSGFNLTVPHKELVLPLCDKLDERAQEIGAVNTLSVVDGRIYGTNTDIFGFVQNIRANAPEFDFKAAPAVVLGAGGAAKACVYGLLQQGVREVRVINRTREKAEALADMDERIDVWDWSLRKRALDGAGLLVNTTSLGMDGQPALEIDLSALPKEALVNDIVYAPLYTPLLEQAQVQGNPVVTGIGMLLHQARPAFELWFGVLPEVDEPLSEKVLSA